MLQNGSRMTMVDNSGVKRVRGFWVRAGKRQTAHVGDVRVASVQEMDASVTGPNTSKRGDVVRVLIVRTRGPVRRPSGATVRFDENAGMIVTHVAKTNSWAPMGTRMQGPVSRRLRRQGHGQAVARADHVL